MVKLHLQGMKEIYFGDTTCWITELRGTQSNVLKNWTLIVSTRYISAS